jgi:phthiocerol/phenolphthiocerol synthesis type-I polyketide synthase E
MATDTIGQLLPLWRRALGHDQLQETDDFFAVGGDSLKGIQLLTEVTAAFGVEVPPLAMYDEASTPLGMASLIDHLIQPAMKVNNA